MIVDDEEIIVNGLYEIFNSTGHPDLDVYKAYSGEEAIDWLNRTRFDIVLTDIKMPEIDGIQLLDEIKRNWPQCRVIFLTGHNEFEYVYKAIQHKNVSYILKTEDPGKVVFEVENAIKDIEKGIKIENLIHKAKEEMSMVQNLLQKDYLIHLIHKDTSLEISKSQFEKLSIPLYAKEPVILLLGHVDNIAVNLSYWEKMQYLNSIRFIMNQNIISSTRSIIIMDDNYRFIFFIQPNELLAEHKPEADMLLYRRTVSFLKGMLEVIQTACRESLNASITFVLGGEPTTWENAAEKYYSLSQLLNYRIGMGTGMLIIDNELGNTVINTNLSQSVIDHNGENAMYMLLNQKKLEAFELYLESGQKERYFMALSELVIPMKTATINCNLKIMAYYKIALSLLSYISRSKLADKLSSYSGSKKLMQIDTYQSWDEAVGYLFQLSNELFRCQCEEVKTRADNAIAFIHEFIKDHLDENLSLVRLAEQVYLNPSYLSRLYKQVTGICLSNFIDIARVEKAKELLNSENIKIYEVAKAVGYETPGSFTRFFKKLTGVSPQEYFELVKASA